MYESLGVAVIPNLHAEGMALVSDLTVVGAVWLALCVVTCLAIITVSFRDAGTGSATDDGEIAELSSPGLSRAA